MPPEPSVGVVIPAYDAARFLGQAIESVLATGHPALDVVVVDDGSADDTAAVAVSFGAPVRVVRRANGGIGAARNSGVAVVRGELLAFLDADDRWTAEALSSRLPVLAEHPEVDVAFGSQRTFAERAAPGPLVAATLPAGMLIRRAAFDRVGPFLEGTAVSEGLDWLLRARELGLAEVVVDAHVQWRRVHGANNSLRRRADIGEFALTLKASLDRRRRA